MYQEEDIKKILIDLKNKVEACVEVGLGDLAYTLNEALNCIEELSGLSAYAEKIIKALQIAGFTELQAKVLALIFPTNRLD